MELNLDSNPSSSRVDRPGRPAGCCQPILPPDLCIADGNSLLPSSLTPLIRIRPSTLCCLPVCHCCLSPSTLNISSFFSPFCVSSIKQQRITGCLTFSEPAARGGESWSVAWPDSRTRSSRGAGHAWR